MREREGGEEGYIGERKALWGRFLGAGLCVSDERGSRTFYNSGEWCSMRERQTNLAGEKRRGVGDLGCDKRAVQAMRGQGTACVHAYVCVRPV